MRLLPLASILSIVSLSACAGEPDFVSEEEILARAEVLIAPQPGLYRTTSTMTEFALPGASPQEATRMQQRLGGLQPQVVEGCLAAGEDGFLSLVQAMQEGSCSSTRFDTSETSLHAEMTCEIADGTISEIVMRGKVSAQDSRLQSRVVQQGPGIPGGMQRFVLMVESRRLGDCPAPTEDGETETLPD
ncbi:DUF3617 domain-containing protein [Aurantiacibacter sp. MUD11]|uniref:DUF3617 domain-containing protein n=1 Tax=Aurantiacibacter sp. MUD11 TaxID=3003265 RepID=UPI0022AA3CC4|nr:DUF3617 domain-containing protein [Aurantiacibacter sp. MUD11]WAT17789.1 DUF3617 domain-containing protein [Aurantiacibacter sp. MUD11]